MYKPVLSVFIQCLVIYSVYYAVWVTLIRPGIRRHAGNSSPGAAAAARPMSSAEQRTAVWTPAADPSEPAARRADQLQRRRSRPGWRERATQQLAQKSLREKLTELLGSMLLAAIFSTIAACAVPLLLNDQATSEQAAAYLWLAMVGTLGSWAILVPSKFVEGRLEDQAPMRITLMLLGAILGVAAWSIGDAVMLKQPGWHEPMDVGRGLVTHEMLEWRIQDGANPPIAVYVAYFAFLFVLMRWWRQTEYTRGSRMSIWCVSSCVFMAWLLHIFWWFPQPLGMMAAGVIALSTQLASPWMPPSRRRAISEEAERGGIQQ